MQEAYVRAFTGLADFRGDASLSSWLTRIALNEALGRLRATVDLAAVDSLQERKEPRIVIFSPMNPESDPEHAAGRSTAPGTSHR